MASNKNNFNFLIRDATIIVLSIVVAVMLVKTDVFINILDSAKGLEWLGSFIAGMFFTSIFTTAPAIITLGEIARANSILLTAFFGALGAVVGDLIILRFVRDRFSEHLIHLVGNKGGGVRLKTLIKLRYFRWLTFLVGGLIIASPLPDELGISLLGFSKIRPSFFIPLSFTFNFLGILVIGLVARSIL